MAEKRKLATVVFADVAGYTSLMQADEKQAMLFIQDFRELLEKIVPLNNGEIIQYYGDGVLLTFDSAKDGVECSIGLQEAFLDRKIPVRVGMHLGDVVYKNGNVFGNGVNVASRIESMGIPGCILVSKAIRDQISNKSGFQLSSLGSFEFKNVKEPMEIFALANEGLAIPSKGRIQGKLKEKKNNRLSWGLPIVAVAVAVILGMQMLNRYGHDESSQQHNKTEQMVATKLGVLPFLNTRSDADTDYLGFALADQIIGGLVYVKDINIRPSSSIRKYEKTTTNPTTIAKELDVEYLLLGNYLMEGDLIRLNIELVNTSTNSIIIREPLELNFESAFELQDIVSKKIVERLKLHFSTIEQERIRKNIPSNALAYEYHLRAISYPFTTEGNELAIEMHRKSIALDSSYAPAYSQLGNRTHRQAHYGLKGSEEIRKAEEYYLKALALNDELLSAYSGLTSIYTEAGRMEESIANTRKIFDINPYDIEAHLALGYIYRYVGLLDESIDEMLKAEALDKTIQTTVGISYVAQGAYEKAYESFVRQNNLGSNTLYVAFQGMIKYREGKLEEAMTLFNEVRATDPGSLHDLWITAFVALIDGNKDPGLQAAREFESYNIFDSEAWFFIGNNYALLGDIEGALRCLNKSVEGGYFNYPFYVNEPFLDTLRDDDRFKALLSMTEQKHLEFKNKLSVM